MLTLSRFLPWPYAVELPELRGDHQLERIGSGRSRYQALGIDPQFRLRRRLPAGWYMLEVLMKLPVSICQARLYYDTGNGESEDNSCGLPVRSGRLAKRLIYLPQAAAVRFDPLESPGEFEIGHFRLVRMSERAANKRLRKKLGLPEAADAAEFINPGSIWNRYNKLFEPPTGQSAISYAEWISSVEQPGLPSPADQRAGIAQWAWQPTFSVLVPTYNTGAEELRACLDSVLAQTYPHWELCVADDASTAPHVRAILRDYEVRDPRIKIYLRSANGHISAATNSALRLATGEFVALLDHDDALAPHALFAVAKALQERPDAQLLYTDEDKLDQQGRRYDPYFKPNFSPDLLYSQNYFSHFGIYRRQLVEAVGGFRQGFEGSQDYDLVLRCTAQVRDPQDVLHVPQILYHWRAVEGSTAAGHDNKDYASDAARRALQEYFDAQHPGVQVSISGPGLYRHRWPLPDPAPMVSLIVPTRDGYDILKTCIESILSRTAYPNYEILLVDNQSTCPLTLTYMAQLADNPRVRVLRYDRPFNYSAINNFAVREAQGALVGLINNDIEVLNADWLGEMVSHAIRPEIGCVGAKLYYPDGTLQHCGIVLGIGGVAGHSHKYFPGDAPGYFSRLRIIHNVSAVTGAALVLRKEVFDAVGGLDEHGLTVAFNDVDLCLKVKTAGFRNLWTPFAELVHHESKSRGLDQTPEKQARFRSECEVMQQRWGDLLRKDPYYNPNLTLLREDYSFSTGATA